jgi:hypothetical protein
VKYENKTFQSYEKSTWEGIFRKRNLFCKCFDKNQMVSKTSFGIKDTFGTKENQAPLFMSHFPSKYNLSLSTSKSMGN